MPHLSIFTPCGMLECSGQRPHAESTYEALKASIGGQLSTEEGTQLEAFIYCAAMGAARAFYTNQRAAKQRRAMTTSDGLADIERDFGLTPSPFDTIFERQTALAGRKRVPLGGTVVNIENAIRDVIGAAHFARYYTYDAATAALWPDALGDAPMNLQLPTVPRKLIAITQNISIGLGAPQAVTYETLVGDALNMDGSTEEGAQSNTLLQNDILVVDGGASGLEERVVVEAVGAGTFTATFEKAHAAGTVGTTAPWPAWASSKRHALIVVDADTAEDPEARRKIDEVMRRMASCVSRWDIVAGAIGATSGPFVPGSGLPGITPIEATTF